MSKSLKRIIQQVQIILLDILNEKKNINHSLSESGLWYFYKEKTRDSGKFKGLKCEPETLNNSINQPVFCIKSLFFLFN